MPIRPENRHRYPADWPEISRRIRVERAGGRCECIGQCGTEHAGRCAAVNGRPSPMTGSVVILTVAHLDHTPEHCDEANLLAACQACHLRYDAAQHRATAAATRRAALEAAGQLALLPPPAAPKPPPVAYWEHRGPRDWQPVEVDARYGPGRGEPEQPFPEAHTGAAGPRNVSIRRADGSRRVVPVRSLRRKRPA